MRESLNHDSSEDEADGGDSYVPHTPTALVFSGGRPILCVADTPSGRKKAAEEL